MPSRARARSRPRATRRASKRTDPDRTWSGRVTRESNALDLDPGVFTWDEPRRIARSLRDSAERSDRRKADPFRSAMSMLVFYVNRAGSNLPAARRRILERAKDELRRLYGRPPAARTRRRSRGRAVRGGAS